MSLLTSVTSRSASTRESKKSVIVSLRWVLIIAASCLILFQHNRASHSALPDMMVLFLILSNFAVIALPAHWFYHRAFDVILVLVDISLISMGVMITGQFTTEFYLLYFLVLMIAALSETTRSLILSACVVSFAYLLMEVQTTGAAILMHTDTLIRVPFLLIVTLFYGHLSQRVRSESNEKRLYKKRLGLASKLRRLTINLTKTLDRKQILRSLVEAERRLCKARYAAIFSRQSRQVLYDSGDRHQRLTEERFAVLLAAIEQEAKQDPSIETRGNASENKKTKKVFNPSWVERHGYVIMPMTGKFDSDLFVCLAGDFEDELLEYARLLIFNGVMALRNAGQYKSLVHEVEKRQAVAKELHQALEFKGQFLANVSHELRTPLHSFIGFGELLDSGAYGELGFEQRSVIQRMVSNAQDLLQLINNILDMSKLEADAARVTISSGDPCEFAEDVVETCLSLLRDKPVALRMDLSSNLCEIHTDWKLMRHIALNLISNAIKFTFRGEVVLSLSFDREKAEFTLEVRDTGIGIDEKDFAEIFSAFRQLDHAYTKRYAGTGLGLAITKRQVEMLGGRIEVSSKVNFGSTFRVTVPVTPADEPVDSRLLEQPSPQA